MSNKIIIGVASQTRPFFEFLRRERVEAGSAELHQFLDDSPPGVLCLVVGFDSREERRDFVERLLESLSLDSLKEISPIVPHRLKGRFMLAFLGAVAREVAAVKS